MLPFGGLSVRLSVIFVHCAPTTEVIDKFLLHTTSPCLSHIAVKIWLTSVTTPTSLNFAPKWPTPVDLNVGDIRWKIVAEWLNIARWSQWRAYGKPPSLFRMIPSTFSCIYVYSSSDSNTPHKAQHDRHRTSKQSWTLTGARSATDVCVECFELALKTFIWTDVGPQHSHVLQSVGVPHSLRHHQIPVPTTQTTAQRSIIIFTACPEKTAP